MKIMTVFFNGYCGSDREHPILILPEWDGYMLYHCYSAIYYPIALDYACMREYGLLKIIASQNALDEDLEIQYLRLLIDWLVPLKYWRHRAIPLEKFRTGVLDHPSWDTLWSLPLSN